MTIALEKPAPAAAPAAPGRSSTLRPEIQGLRALAVLMVVVYHLRPAALPGGFVGVDLFFVISGFLITSHLVREHRVTGRILFAAFWAKRARRLLPAALLVLGSSAVAAVVWVPSVLWRDTFGQILASALYFQNFFLAASSVDYLGADNQPTLVQHFWSLSTEEQFYLAWPIFLALLLVGARRRPNSLAVGIAALLGVSLAVSIVWTATSPQSAYFATPTRAWEFAAGALIVVLPKPPEKIRSAVFVAGLATILIACITFSKALAFPGWIAVVPVVGAVLIIWAGSPSSASLAARISGPRLVQYVGSISYSVYLWHWPLIVLYPAITGRVVDMKAAAGILVLTFVLAALTKPLVEDRFRARGQDVRPTWRFWAGTGSSMAVVVVLAVVPVLALTQQVAEQNETIRRAVQDGGGCFGAAAMVPTHDCRNRFSVNSTVDPVQAAADIPWESGAFSIANQQTHCGPVHCSFGAGSDATVTVAVVGDSHAQQLINPLVLYGKSRHWQVKTYTLSGCSMLMGLQDDPTPAPGAGGRSCPELGRGAMSEIIGDSKVDVVLLANYTEKSRVSSPQAIQYIRELRSAGKRVVIVRDLPGPAGRQNAPSCVQQHSQQIDPCSSVRHSGTDWMSDIAQQTEVPEIDLSDYVCGPSTCHIVVGGVIVYFDTNHLTGTFASTLSPFLGRDVESVLSVGAAQAVHSVLR